MVATSHDCYPKTLRMPQRNNSISVGKKPNTVHLVTWLLFSYTSDFVEVSTTSETWQRNYFQDINNLMHRLVTILPFTKDSFPQYCVLALASWNVTHAEEVNDKLFSFSGFNMLTSWWINIGIFNQNVILMLILFWQSHIEPNGTLEM